MKNLFSIVLAFGIMLVAIPAIALIDRKNVSADTQIEYENESVKILDEVDKTVAEYSMRDYIIGSVLAQMPADFEIEALKAQAVIAHTYILRQQIAENQNPTENLMGADVSTDVLKYNAFFTKEQAKILYGESFEGSYKKIENAVDQVFDEIMVYENQPILVPFHSMSGEKTESAEVIWGEEYPYLVPVDIVEDTTQKGYSETREITFDEFSARLSQSQLSVEFSNEKEKWIEQINRTQSGTIVDMSVCGVKIKGSEFKDIFSLRSQNFEIQTTENGYLVTTKGVGHGVGLSQYGANKLAQEGKRYDEILKYYYTDIDIVKA